MVSFPILRPFGPRSTGDAPRRCRELAGKLSRGDVTHETAKDLSDDDGYLHSDDEGITDLPLASSLVEHALDALVEQGEVKKTGDDYALVVDDDGDWFVSVFRIALLDSVRSAPNSNKKPPTAMILGDDAARLFAFTPAVPHKYHTQVRRPREPAPQVAPLLEAAPELRERARAVLV